MFLKKLNPMNKIMKKNNNKPSGAQISNIYPKKSDDNYLDTVFYSALYSDLEENGIKEHEALQKHYQIFGAKEGRLANISEWLHKNNFPKDIIPPNFKLIEIQTINKDVSNSRKIVLELMEFLSAPLNKRFSFSNDASAQAEFLFRLGKFYHGEKAVSEANYLWSLLLNSVASQDDKYCKKIIDASGYEDELYEEFNPDLLKAGLDSMPARLLHFLRHGQKEDRAYSVDSWLIKHGLPGNLLSAVSSLKEALLRTEKYGNPIKILDALNSLVANNLNRVWFFESAKDNSKIYLKAGLSLLASGGDESKRERANNLFLIACSFDPENSEALEQIGHYYSSKKEYRTAANFFENAIKHGASASKIVPHMAWMCRASNQHDRAYAIFEKYIPQFRTSPELLSQIDDFCQEIWSAAEDEMQMDVLLGRREALVEHTNAVVQKLYHLRMLSVGVLEIPSKIKNISISKVVLVGDFYVPQCQRYRIDQKVEQLAAAGVDVVTINWTDLKNHTDDLCFYDAVIFYRVPAVPPVIRAIAQVNAVGRLSIYEIDDLLFDPSYPPAIDTYGGAVDADQYRGLIRGMALFNAAARLCRVGIASTEPLREKLANLVFSGKCILHRNGLDSFYDVDLIPNAKSEKLGIHLFYGSGTLAHNNDFCDLALPAIRKIMEKRSDVHLIIAGHLRLPSRFLAEYEDRVSLLPATKDISLYYDYLKLADINLAVLHADPITDCKSELKWFEAAYFGIPSVLSVTRNYLDVISDGDDALLARNVEEWEVALNRLIDSQEYREKIAANARKRVLKEYSTEMLGRQLRASLEAVVQSLSLGGKKKRVALVNVFFAPQSIGGATRVFEGNIQNYQKSYAEEIEPVVFCANVHQGVPHRVQVEMQNGIRVYRANTIFRRNMDWEPKDAAMGEVFRRFLEIEKPDCVHFHCVQRLTASIVEVTKEMGIPYLLTMHDAWWFSDLQFLVDPAGNVYPDGHPGIEWATKAHPPEGATIEQSLQRSTYLRRLVHGAAEVFTVSESFANICRKNGFPQTRVSTNGISSDLAWRNKDASQTQRVVCAHIGGMSAHKGYDLLKSAVLESQPQNIEFLIVDHAHDVGWKMNSFWGKVPVSFIGRQPQTSIQDLYARIDVLFAPSLWPESFGLVTREAAASKCWVVASNIGAIGEDIVHGENGFLVDPNHASLINVLQEIDANHMVYKLPAPFTEFRTDEDQAKDMINAYNSLS